MILSFGPDAGAVTPTMLALSVPSVVALACYLAAAIPGATYLEVAHAAHAVPIETPWIVNRLLNEHLRDATRQVAS